MNKAEKITIKVLKVVERIAQNEVEKQFLAGRQSIQQFITSRKDRRKGKTRSE